jgi:hypothetical protein
VVLRRSSPMNRRRITHRAKTLDLRRRTNLCHRSFERIAPILEPLVSPDHERYLLSSDARLALRSALTNAHHFTAIILPLFMRRTTLGQLCDTKQHIDDAYSIFGGLVASSSKFPHLRKRWQEIKQQKCNLRKILKKLEYAKPWKHSVIHRVTHRVNDPSLPGRRIALDPTNPDKYTDPSKFVQMSSKTCHVVGRSKRRIEFHVFVSASADELSDDQIRAILCDHTGMSSIPSKWFLGAHVVNLGRLDELGRWMKAVTPHVVSTLTACRLAKRSPDREDAGVIKGDGSKMVSTNFHCDQQGYMRDPRNFERLDEDSRYELMQEHDHVLDGVVLVLLRLWSGPNFRSPNACFHGYGGTGRSKALRIAPSQQVCSPICSSLIMYWQGSGTCSFRDFSALTMHN